MNVNFQTLFHNSCPGNEAIILYILASHINPEYTTVGMSMVGTAQHEYTIHKHTFDGTRQK